MLRERHTAYVGLLLHWYGEGADEPIALKGRETLPLCVESLGRLREDVLAIFRAGSEGGDPDPLPPPST
jgi:hypothetical protein